MSTESQAARVPEVVDAWRMLASRRGFEGRVPLSRLTRLQGLLADAEGEVSYSVQFDRDPLQVDYAELRVEARLPLLCQRTLERFELPVQLVQRLGLLRDEEDEAALPEQYEALLVPEDGQLNLLDMVEDELVLAVPVVPINPDSDAVQVECAVPAVEMEKASPFAALAGLKKS